MPRSKHVNIIDGVSRTEALELGRRLSVNFERIPLSEFRAGIAHEREHDSVLKGNALRTAMTALDHLKKHPDYYSKLEKAEKTMKTAAAIYPQAPYRGDPEHEQMMIRREKKKMKKTALMTESEINSRAGKVVGSVAKGPLVGAALGYAGGRLRARKRKPGETDEQHASRKKRSGRIGGLAGGAAGTAGGIAVAKHHGRHISRGMRENLEAGFNAVGQKRASYDAGVEWGMEKAALDDDTVRDMLAARAARAGSGGGPRGTIEDQLKLINAEKRAKSWSEAKDAGKIKKRLTRNQRRALAASGLLAATSAGAYAMHRRKKNQGEQEKTARDLHVGNLPFKATEKDLMKHFGGHGAVDAAVAKDRETGRSRGFGQVGFKSDAQAARAAKMLHGSEMGGRKLTVGGMKKAAAFWNRKKKKKSTGSRTQHVVTVSDYSPSGKLTNEHIGHLHGLAKKYDLDKDYVMEAHAPWHPEFPNATEHNIAADSDLQRHHGGPGVKWDHKRWGKPNPLL